VKVHYYDLLYKKIVATCDAMCWLFWDATIFCKTLCSPNEDFGRWNKR
jgi:hypothetical protein